MLGVRGAILAYFAGPIILFGVRELAAPEPDVTLLVVDVSMPLLGWFLGSYPGAAVGLYLRPRVDSDSIAAAFAGAEPGAPKPFRAGMRSRDA